MPETVQYIINEQGDRLIQKRPKNKKATPKGCFFVFG